MGLAPAVSGADGGDEAVGFGWVCEGSPGALGTLRSRTQSNCRGDEARDGKVVPAHSPTFNVAFKFRGTSVPTDITTASEEWWHLILARGSVG